MRYKMDTMYMPLKNLFGLNGSREPLTSEEHFSSTKPSSVNTGSLTGPCGAEASALSFGHSHKERGEVDEEENVIFSNPPLLLFLLPLLSVLGQAQWNLVLYNNSLLPKAQENKGRRKAPCSILMKVTSTACRK